MTEVGKRTADAGIKFAFHPHAWTLVERQPELDMMMDMTDPTLVYLVLDTGHATLGGIDPVKCLRDYYSRIAAIHLKDAEAKYNTANGWKGPAPSEEEHNKSRRSTIALLAEVTGEPGDVLQIRRRRLGSRSRSCYLTSKSFVPADAPLRETSTLYFPVGHPSGFEMWNSVVALPVGAIVWTDSSTSWPS